MITWLISDKTDLVPLLKLLNRVANHLSSGEMEGVGAWDSVWIIKIHGQTNMSVESLLLSCRVLMLCLSMVFAVSEMGVVILYCFESNVSSPVN